MNSDDKELLLSLLRSSPSAHNTQPFRIRFVNDFHWEIWGVKNKMLPVADPAHKDFMIGYGSFLQSLEFILPFLNLTIKELVSTERIEFNKPVFQLSDIHLSDRAAEPTSPERTVFDLISKRFSYRGVYKTTVSNLENIEQPNFKILFLNDPIKMKNLAQLYDQINYEFLTKSGYIEELYKWLRFSKSHPFYLKDGLNPQAMSLSLIESIGASQILNPSLFHFLNKMGILKMFLTESTKNLTSSAFAAITTGSNDFVEMGKSLLKAWIRLTELNLYGSPLSVLMDKSEVQGDLREIFQTKDQIINIFRVGPLPNKFKRPSIARIPWQEMELK